MAQATKVEQQPPGDRATRRQGWPMDSKMKEEGRQRNSDEFRICSIWGQNRKTQVGLSKKW